MKVHQIQVGNTLIEPFYKQNSCKRNYKKHEYLIFEYTIPEASQLVLEAGSMANGGEIFICDMGNPVKILDLATNMIIQKGLKVGIDINIEFTGLRPGEKLFEELLLDSEDLIKTYNDLIYISKNLN